MTIYEFRKAFKDIATATKKDGSPRGVCTVLTDEIVPGDLVVIGGEFVEITAPTIEEINEQIEETSNELKKLNAEREAVNEEIREMAAAGTLFDYVKTTPRELRKQRLYEELTKDAEISEMLLKIHRSNARSVQLRAVIVALCEALKANAGKPCGEKTAAKISEAVRAAAGVRRIAFDRRICSQLSDSFRVWGENFGDDYICTKYDEARHGRPLLIDAENRINGDITPADFPEPPALILDPYARLLEYRAAVAEVEAAKEAYNKAAERANALTVRGFERAEKLYNVWKR